MPRCFHESGTADDDTADRGAEAFAKAEGDAVEAGAVGFQSLYEIALVFTPRDLRGDGFPEAGAVKVEFDAIAAGESGYCLAVFQREDLAAEGIFEGDEAGRRIMDVVIKDGMFLHILQRETMAVGGDDTFNQGTAKTSHAAGFPFEDMGSVVAEDGMRGLGEESADGKLVSHRAGQDEKGGGEAGELGDIGFEVVCGRVFGKDVVEEGGVLDGGQHGGGGGGNDITC